MSLTEILAEIPKLSFAERQQLVRHAIELEDQDLTAEEKAILDRRIEDFRLNPQAGIPAEQLKAQFCRGSCRDDSGRDAAPRRPLWQPGIES